MKLISGTFKAFVSGLFLFLCLTFVSCNGVATDTTNPSKPGNPANSQNNTDFTAVEFAKNLTIGWNLGNTLDAHGSDDYAYGLRVNTETYWGMPETTEAMIKAVHAEGFKAIRIPVSWHNHISKTDTTNYQIDSAWMARVKEVVDYAYDDGMYVIINIHHDNMSITEINSHPGFALSDNQAIQTKSMNFISKVWTQIAQEFASYNDHLIFEVLNEPRDMGGKAYSNGTVGAEFSPAASVLPTANTVITKYEQAGLDAIRAVQGNENRYVMVPAYAAAIDALDSYTMPRDSAENKLLLSTHAYSPYEFAMNNMDDTTFDESDKTSLDSLFNKLKITYTSKGIGVVMGEASASDKNNTAEREKWAAYYFTKAADAGIPVMLWDNMKLYSQTNDAAESHGYYNRSENSWYFPTIITAMMDASTTATDFSGIVDAGLLDGVLDLTSWSVNQQISSGKFAEATNNTKLVFTVENSGKLKLIDKWGEDLTIISGGTITGGSKNEDGTFAISAGTVTYKPTSAEWTKIKTSGLIVFGLGPKITKLELN